MKDFRIKRKTRFYQIFGILLLCIAFISIVSNITLAWFKDESITSNGDANILLIGTLELDVQTNFNFYNLALAPDTIYEFDNENRQIGTYIKTANTHDVEGAYVRIKYTTTRTNIGGTSQNNIDLLQLYFDGNLTTNTSYSSSVKGNWYLHTDNYYYYIGAIESDWICFNKGYKTSNTFTNVEANAPVVVTYVVETVQRQFGAYSEVWNDTPAIFDGWAQADEEAKWGKQ